MSSKPPQIAVAVRTAGRDPVFLRRALASIHAQTTPPHEVIVFNVGVACAEVDEVVRQTGFSGGAIVVRHHAPLRQAAAANRAVDSTRAEWVTFLDDDDTWEPQFLERTGQVLMQEVGATDFGGVVTRTLAVHERLVGREIQERRRKPFNPALCSVDLAALAYANQFTNNALIFRREAFVAVGAFREDLSLLYDWEFNVRLAARYRIECVPEVLARYHLRPSDDGAPNSSREEMERASVKIRNEWLRADLSAGRVGLGQLSLAGETVGVGRALAGFNRLRMEFRRWFGGWTS